jgi:ubiquinone/menaquinone biosynthesis C-methylase UbiE
LNETSDTTDFSAIARIYERLGEAMTYPLAVQALDRAAITTGEHVIDVATGAGVLAVEAAVRGARVLATDIAPAMVARTAERLEPFSACDARVMNFEALDVPDAEFDAAFSIIGVLAFSTWSKGLSELVRVTKPGGRIVVTMWTENRDATPAYVLKRVFEACFPGRELWPKDFFPSWTTAGLAQALQQAGCSEVEVRVCSGEWSPVSIAGAPVPPGEIMDDADSVFRNFPGYASLTAAERERLRTPLAEAFVSYADLDGIIRMPTEAFVACGWKVT